MTHVLQSKSVTLQLMLIFDTCFGIFRHKVS